MASNVDVTLPADGEKVSKAEFRAQFLTIKNEIEALQKYISMAGRLAFEQYPDHSEIESMIRRIVERNDKLAYQIATGVVDL